MGRSRYTPEEDAIIRRAYPTGGPSACAELLGRSAYSCRARARKLGVRQKEVRREKWTEQHERYCLALLIRACEDTGHTPLSVLNHMQHLIRRAKRDRNGGEG